MFREAGSVVLTVDLPDYGLKAGDIGVIAMVHGLLGHEVEFITLDGATVAVTSLGIDQVRPIAGPEIAHVRSVAAGTGSEN